MIATWQNNDSYSWGVLQVQHALCFISFTYHTLQIRAFLAHIVSYYQTQSEQSILKTIVRKEQYSAAEATE